MRFEIGMYIYKNVCTYIIKSKKWKLNVENFIRRLSKIRPDERIEKIKQKSYIPKSFVM